MSNAIIAYKEMVPPRPSKSKWEHQLRWLIAVMDDDDSSIQFVASCLSHCIKNDGLTQRQAQACQRILDRVSDMWMRSVLDCQACSVNDLINWDEPENDLGTLSPKGSC